MNGNSTSNHENIVPPPLHITFNNHVQNRIYTAWKTNKYMEFSLLQPNKPRQ
jgi:hypothetical protein